MTPSSSAAAATADLKHEPGVNVPMNALFTSGVPCVSFASDA